MPEGDFITGGTRYQCPQCKRLQLFQRSISVSSLPITVRCSFPDCGHTVAYSVADAEQPPRFPKIDPINRVHGNWIVEMQSAKDYWKPVDGQLSFRERCNGIATHLAGGLQLIETLKNDLNQLAESMTQQFSAEWGIHASFLTNWKPSRVQNFIKEPFLCLPLSCEDKFVGYRSRLFLHPDFFSPNVGLPIQSFLGGFNAQLITPYTLINFPLETWLQNLLTIQPAPELRVVGDRIVGRDLFFCWKDIPGTVPAKDHQEDAPLIQIKDQLEARTWLARMGVCPWNEGILTEQHAFRVLWNYFDSEDVKPYHREIFKDFVEHGRLALFVAKPIEAWEVALSIGSYIFGQKLVILSSLEDKANYANLFKERISVKANSSFHWKVAAEVNDLDNIAWHQFQYIILDYNDNIPPECLERLFDYNGRLIIISQDAVMDTFEENWEAARFYGLIAKTIWHPRLPAVNTAATFDQNKMQGNLVTALLHRWHTESKIAKGTIDMV